MSKKVKMALGVAAAIAIPFYAPAIAGSLGMSGVLGSATIGALGGALGANLQGGDWRKGATLGAIGGGYQGYQAAQAAQAGTAAGGAEAAASTPAPTGAPTLPASVTDASGLLTQPTAATTGVPTSPLPGLGGTGAGFTGTSAAASPGLLSGVGEALGGPSVYVPAGIQLGAAYLGQQQAAEAQEQADDYAKQQAAEIERQRQLEANIFARREALSKSLEEQAAATNPEYFGLQSARRMQEAGALATREAEQAAPFYKPGLRMAEKRRGQLATARGTGTAYDVGYGTGVEQKTRLTQAAIESLGSAPRTDYSSLANYYGGQASDAMRGGLDVGRLFGDITGRYEREQDRRREEERLRKLEEARGVRA
jgi:hypothetical protein